METDEEGDQELPKDAVATESTTNGKIDCGNSLLHLFPKAESQVALDNSSSTTTTVTANKESCSRCDDATCSSTSCSVKNVQEGDAKSSTESDDESVSCSAASRVDREVSAETKNFDDTASVFTQVEEKRQVSIKVVDDNNNKNGNKQEKKLHQEEPREGSYVVYASPNLAINVQERQSSPPPLVDNSCSCSTKDFSVNKACCARLTGDKNDRDLKRTSQERRRGNDRKKTSRVECLSISKTFRNQVKGDSEMIQSPSCACDEDDDDDDDEQLEDRQVDSGACCCSCCCRFKEECEEESEEESYPCDCCRNRCRYTEDNIVETCCRCGLPLRETRKSSKKRQRLKKIILVLLPQQQQSDMDDTAD